VNFRFEPAADEPAPGPLERMESWGEEPAPEASAAGPGPEPEGGAMAEAAMAEARAGDPVRNASRPRAARVARRRRAPSDVCMKGFGGATVGAH
jgi:hypothetical protein